MDSTRVALSLSMFITLAAVLFTQAAKKIPRRYQYSSRLSGQSGIRLLRLMPNEDEAAAIECHLFNYSLEREKGTHLYETLSYVWGDPNITVPILVDGRHLHVTENLYAALLRLRDSSLERTLWVDAICINQADDKEKEHQIQFMERIYSQACRVIVWLGVAANSSDRALEEIRAIAADESVNLSSKDRSPQPFLALLQRAWFRRIWVLQEVAMARRILIMCGRTEVNGYTFCAGLNKLELFNDHPAVQDLIPSVASLMRGAIFRPKYTTGSSMNISLGELMDMYHSHEATKRHDKVYALLGMSSDNPSQAGLSPNYTTPWNKVMRQLITFLLGEEIGVETWDESEIAVIKSKGCILGQVSLVTSDSDRYDRQHVQITFKKTHRFIDYNGEWGHRWTLRASAKPLQQGDLVCLLQGSSNPIIARAFKDHFAIIIIRVTPRHHIQNNFGNVKLPKSLALNESFSNDFLLVWSWETSLEHMQDHLGYDHYMEINNFLPTYPRITLDMATRLRDVALILEDAEEYEEAAKRLQEAIRSYEEVFGKDHLTTLACMDSLALIYKKNRQWKKAEDSFVQLIQVRKRVQGADHPDALSSLANLAFTYMAQECLSTKKAGMVTDLITRIKGNTHMTECEICEVASLLSKNFLTLLFEYEEERVHVTEDLVKAAAGNEKSGEEVMQFLFESKKGVVPISAEVIKAVAGNRESGKEVMKLILEKRKDEIPISVEIVKAAAWNRESGSDIMKHLLSQRAHKLHITEDVVVQIARFFNVDLMRVLLDHGGSCIPITEKTVRVAAENDDHEQKMVKLLLERIRDNIPVSDEMIKGVGILYTNEEVIRLLLERREDNIPIPEEALMKAAFEYNDGMMRFLLQRSKSNVPISEKVVVKGVRNPWYGKEMTRLLLEKRGDDVPISEEVVKAAAGNDKFGKEALGLIIERRAKETNITENVVVQITKSFDIDIMRSLLDRGGAAIPISERVIRIAAGNEGSGEEIVKFLLERRGENVVISEAVVIAAAKNGAGGKEIMRLLLNQRDGHIPISQEVLKAAAENYKGGEEMLRLLLDQRELNVPISEEVVEAVAKNGRSEEVLRILLKQRGNHVSISEEVVMAAAKNTKSEKVLRFLLEQRGFDVPISEEVVKEAASNTTHGEAMMRFLLEHKGDTIPNSEEVMKAAVRNYNGEKLVLLLLERRGGDSLVSEEVLKEAVRYGSKAKTLRALLEHKGGDVAISEEVVKVAAGNSSSGAVELMKILLQHKGNDFLISEEVIKAAVGDGMGPQMVRLLLQRSGYNIPISERVVKAAAWQGYKSSGEESLRALLEQRGDGALVSEEAVIQITKSFSLTEIQLLFNRGGYTNPVSEEVVKAAAGNERCGKEVMELLSERIEDEVLISKEVVKVAAGNEQSGDSVFKFLFKRREDDVPISEELVKIAAENERSGGEIIRVLLERRGGDIPISVEVVKAAAGNRYRGVEVMQLLFEQIGGDIPINEEVVKAAAGNNPGGEKIVQLLLKRRGDDVPITEEVVKAAVSNAYGGKGVMRVLYEHRRDDVLILQERIERLQKG